MARYIEWPVILKCVHGFPVGLFWTSGDHMTRHRITEVYNEFDRETQLNRRRLTVMLCQSHTQPPSSSFCYESRFPQSVRSCKCVFWDFGRRATQTAGEIVLVGLVKRVGK